MMHNTLRVFLIAACVYLAGAPLASAATQNSANQRFSNNADGFSLGGGTTARTLTLTGGDITLVGNAIAYTYNFPAPFSGVTTTLVGLDETQTLTHKSFSGNVGIGTTVPLAALAIGAGTADAMSITGNDLYVLGNIELDGRIYGNGAGLTNVVGAVSGLTATHVPVASGPTTLVDSNIYYVGGNVGIGTSAPLAQLQVGVDPNIPAGSLPAEAIKGNLVVDGKIYGDGSALTGITAANPTVNNVPKSDGTTLIDSVIYSVGGNVGIGTSVPLSTLEVAGGIASIGTGDNYFTSNVGIGTTVPAYLLDVRGTLNASGAVTLGSTLGVTGNTILTGDIAVNGGDITSSGALTVTPTAGNNFNINLSGAGDLAVNTDQLYVDTSLGNVGIGTTAPLAKLQVGLGGPNAMPVADGNDVYVAGNIEFDGKIYGDGSMLTGLASGSGTVNPGVTGYFSYYPSGGTTVDDQAVLYTDTANIGIGTTVPLAALAVGAGSPNVMPVADGNDVYVAGNIEFDGKIYGDGSALTGITSITGLTDNYITRANGSTAIENSIMYDTGTNIGIGTITPLAALDVVGSQKLSGNLSLGGTAYDANRFINLDAQTSQVAAPQYGIYLNVDQTVASAQPLLGISSTSRFSAAAGTQAVNYGLGARSYNTSTGTVSNQAGILGYAYNSAGGAITNAWGLSGYIYNNAAGTIGTAYGGQQWVENTSTGTITNAYAFNGLIRNTNAGGTIGTAYGLALNNWSNLGTINTSYGIYLDNSIDVGATRYAIYSGATSNSYFAGNIGVGTTLPPAALAVGAGQPNDMPVAGGDDVYIAGNLEVDGKIYGDGSALTGVSSISGLTDNYITRANGSTAIENSIMYDSGTNIGIGTIVPAQSLEIRNAASTTRLRITNDNATFNGGVEVYSGSTFKGGYLGLPNTMAFYGPAGNWGVVNLEIDDSIYFSKGSNGVEFMRILATGNVGIGTTAPPAVLAVGRGQPNAMPVADGNDVYIAGHLEVDGRIYGDGGGLTNIPGAITGLTDNYIVRANGTTAIENSIIFDNSVNIGISTSVPLARLDILGVGTTIATSALIIRDSTRTAKVTVLDNGNVGIGTPTPVNKLTVFGGVSSLDSVGGYATYASGASLVTHPRGEYVIGSSSGDGITNAGFTVSPGVSAGTQKSTFLEIRTNPVNSASTYRFQMSQTPTRSEFIASSNTGSSVGNPIYFTTQGSGYTFPAIFINNSASQNVGIGTDVAVSRLHVSTDNSLPNAMSITGSDLYVKGNIEFDGRIYGDGTGLTGTITLWDAIGDPAGSGSIAFGSTVQTMDWATANTQNALTINTNALTSGTGFSLLSTSAGLTGDLANITASGSNAAVTGNALKVGLTGAAAVGTALNVTSAGSAGYALRVNDDGTYTDTTSFVVNYLGNVGVGTALPPAALAVGPGTPNAMPVAGGDDLYVGGNIEFDGKIYGDGSALTGTSVTWDAIGDPLGAGSIAFGSTVQTMDWATANTQSALTLNGNALTTGKLFTLAHTTSVIADTGSMMRITSNTNDTGGATNGVLLDLIGSGSTAGTQFLQTYAALSTGTGQKIVTNALTTGTAFIIPHTTSVISGTGSLARISSSSNDTSTTNGVLLDLVSSASTAGTQFMQTYSALSTGIGQSIVVNALAAGTGLSLTSNSTGLTGDLANITASGSNAAVTGNALKVGLTGAAAVGTALNVTSAGSAGYALRVNDDGTYTDTTSFVVDYLGNVGVGTALPPAALAVGPGTPNAMPVAGGDDLFVAGNIEFDGRIYGDGAGLTGTTTLWDAIGDPAGAGSIAFGSTVQTMDWATANTQNALTINANALTSGTGFSLLSTSAGLTGDLANITASGSNAAVTGNTLKVGLTGAAAVGTALNVTTAGSAGYALRVNDDGTYTDATPFVVNFQGNVGIGVTSPVAKLFLGSDSTQDVAHTNELDILAYRTTLSPVAADRAFGIFTSSTLTPLVSVLNSGNVGIATTLPSALLQVGAARFNVTAAGNVGIGTVAPVFPLSLYDPGVPSVPLLKIEMGGGTSAANTGDLLYLKSNSGVLGNRVGIRFGITASEPNASARIVAIDDAEYGAHIVVETRSTGSAGIDTYERFRVTSLGNVGIGTTVPISTLEIAAAGTMAIPRGTAPTVDKIGHIAVDTTDDQLVYFGSAKRVLPYERTVCVTVENLVAGDDNFGFFAAPDNVTLQRSWCHCQGTCTTAATMTLEIVQTGTAGPTVDAVTGTTTCAAITSAPAVATLSGNVAVTALDLVRFDVTNTPAPLTDKYTFCMVYTFDAQ